MYHENYWLTTTRLQSKAAKRYLGSSGIFQAGIYHKGTMIFLFILQGIHHRGSPRGEGGSCSLVPFQNCPMFPCSHTISLHCSPFNKFALILRFHPLICKALFPCSPKGASCSLQCLPMFLCFPKLLWDPHYSGNCNS